MSMNRSRTHGCDIYCQRDSLRRLLHVWVLEEMHGVCLYNPVTYTQVLLSLRGGPRGLMYVLRDVKHRSSIVGATRTWNKLFREPLLVHDIRLSPYKWDTANYECFGPCQISLLSSLIYGAASVLRLENESENKRTKNQKKTSPTNVFKVKVKFKVIMADEHKRLVLCISRTTYAKFDWNSLNIVRDIAS